MKTKEEIEKKITQLNEMIDELHEERNEQINKYTGCSEEYNKDFFSDLNCLLTEINILKWVIS